MSVKCDPSGMKMDTNLYFYGKAASARDFYARVFGGSVPFTAHWKDRDPSYCPEITVPEEKKDWILHTSVIFGSNSIMICDFIETHEIIGNTVSLTLNFDDLDKMKKIFNDLGEGGKVQMPVAQQFWGAHYAVVQDKFGVIWGLNCPIKVSPDGEHESKKSKIEE